MKNTRNAGSILKESENSTMDIERYIDDIAIAQLALEKSKLSTVISGKKLLCEIYCIPSHQHQSFYVQIYDDDPHTLLYAKPYISDYTGHNIAMYLFADAVEANNHPACKGDIYCGIKLVPENSKYMQMLMDWLPTYDEVAPVNGFIIDGVFTLIRNHQFEPPVTLAYKTTETIRKNQYTDCGKEFLEDLYLYTENIIGNLLDSNRSRSPHDWIFLARLTDKQYHDAWGG